MRGLDGGQGQGLGWIKGQGVIDAFNGLSDDAHGVLLVRCDLFRSQGGLLPRNADVIIVLSESWSMNCLDVKACYRLRLLSADCLHSVTVLRVAVQGTIEEALVRGKGSLSTLQGRKISALLDVGSVLPLLTNETDPRSPAPEAAVASPSYLPVPPTLPLHTSSSSAVIKDSLDNSSVFLSAAPYLSEEKNIQSVSSSTSSSTSGSSPNSGPTSSPNSSSSSGSSSQAHPSGATQSEEPSVTPIEEIAGQGDGTVGAVPLVAAEPSSSSSSASSADPPLDESGPSSEEPVEAVTMECAIGSEKDADVAMQIDSLALEVPAVTEICPVSSAVQGIVSTPSKPIDISSASPAVTEGKTADSSAVIATSGPASVPVPAPVTVPISVTVAVSVTEKVDQSAAREALAKRWRRAFLRALGEAEKAFSSRNDSCLELSFSVRQAPLLVAPSLTSIFGSAAGALPTLPVAPVVKRTYAPRKKSDLTADSSTTEGAEKPLGVSSSPFSVLKTKEDDDDSDGKALKNRKTERKKDKKKPLVLPTGEIAISSTAAVGTALVVGTASSATTSSTPRSLVLSSTASALPKEEEAPAVVEKPHVVDTSDTVCNFGPEEIDVDMYCESCWSLDRLTETLLSLRSSHAQDPRSGIPSPRYPGIFAVPGLALRMAYTVNRLWQQQAENSIEDAIGGLPRGTALTALAPRGALGLHAGPFNGPGRPPNAHLAPPLAVSLGSVETDVSSSSGGAVASSDANHIFPGLSRSNGRPKIKSEFSAGFHKANSHDSESRLNRKVLCEADRVRLRRAGVGVSDAEQLFWSLIEPFTDVPLDKAKETPKPRPPGSFGGNAAVPPFTQPSSTQLYSVISFRESLRELKRKGVSIDSHVQVHPLQNAMRGDVQLVPTWGQKSAIAASHTQFTIRYVIPRNSSSKSARKSRASQSVNPRGERDKAPVRKRVLDQPMLTTNIRNVRARLEVGVNSRPSSLGGTVNPLFTRLPPIRTVMKPRGKWSLSPFLPLCISLSFSLSLHLFFYLFFLSLSLFVLVAQYKYTHNSYILHSAYRNRNEELRMDEGGGLCNSSGHPPVQGPVRSDRAESAGEVSAVPFPVHHHRPLSAQQTVWTGQGADGGSLRGSVYADSVVSLPSTVCEARFRSDSLAAEGASGRVLQRARDLL